MTVGSDADVRVGLVETPTLGRYLVDPAPSSAPYPLFVGFHGYAEDAERQLERLRRVPDSDRWLRVSIQALHRFYTRRQQQVVGSWMTRLDRERAIADNLQYVDTVMAELARDYALNTTTVYAGFSQGVAMAYRAGLLGTRRGTGLVILAGDVPPELIADTTLAWPRVLVGRGNRDEWYTAERMDADVRTLQTRGVEPRACRFEGGHEWTDDFAEATSRFLHECLPTHDDV